MPLRLPGAACKTPPKAEVVTIKNFQKMISAISRTSLNSTPLSAQLSYTIQLESPFLHLPRELRDDIYCILFNSTRVTHGEFRVSRMGSKLVRPAPHSLAILYTCRQLYAETNDIWVSRVTINFLSPISMMDRLSAIPAIALGNIRHLMVTMISPSSRSAGLLTLRGQ